MLLQTVSQNHSEAFQLMWVEFSCGWLGLISCCPFQAAAFGDEGFWKEFKAQGELLKDLKVRVDDIYDILDKKQRKVC
jgi:hypothetical protein